MGYNIGTIITAVLAAIGSSIAAKRAALTHVTFNLIGTIIFILFLGVFTSVISYFQTQLQLNPEMTLALDRKSTRLNSSHVSISYAVFCLKKKTTVYK